MTPDLRCYGDDIARAADLVPDFDLRSAMDVQSWYTREWQAIADALGFTQHLAAAPRAVPTAADRVTAMSLTGLAAFERALRAGRPAIIDSHARVQSAAIQAMVVTGSERGELWRVTADPTTLASGACYADTGPSQRAFYPDTAPGYFGDGWAGPPPRADSACGWQTPLVLHLGTFPWVYSSRLDAVGPGMRWSSPTDQPALEGLHVATSLMEPASNLRQDARQVAAVYRHFLKHTAPLVAGLPRFEAGRAVAGGLYLRGRYLHPHQASLHLASMTGPRGRIAAVAYNYVLRRFGCFFAVRRATLRALPALAVDVGRIAATSSDPCLREQAEEVARAS